MARISNVVLTSLIVLTTAAGARAQNPPPNRPDSTRSVIVISEKSAFAAGALEWLLPTLGYAYAGNWSRGVPSALVRLTGVVLVAEQQFVIFGEPPPCNGRCVLGAVMAVGGTIWAIVDASATARRHNERRRASILGASVMPVYDADGLGIGLRIPVR